MQLPPGAAEAEDQGTSLAVAADPAPGEEGATGSWPLCGHDWPPWPPRHSTTGS